MAFSQLRYLKLKSRATKTGPGKFNTAMYLNGSHNFQMSTSKKTFDYYLSKRCNEVVDASSKKGDIIVFQNDGYVAVAIQSSSKNFATRISMYAEARYHKIEIDSIEERCKEEFSRLKWFGYCGEQVTYRCDDSNFFKPTSKFEKLWVKASKAIDISDIDSGKGYKRIHKNYQVLLDEINNNPTEYRNWVLTNDMKWNHLVNDHYSQVGRARSIPQNQLERDVLGLIIEIWEEHNSILNEERAQD